MEARELRKTKSKLTGLQLKAAQMLVEEDFEMKGKRTYQQIADELGIGKRTLYDWRQIPEFNAYKSHLTDHIVESHHSFVMSKLVKAIAGGNNGMPSVNAIDTYLKHTGRSGVDKSEVTVKDDGGKPRMSEEDIRRGLDDLLK